MTDHATTMPIVVVPRPRFDRTIKLLLAVTACLVSMSLATILIFVAPAASSNADAVEKLADSTAFEKAQDACYDQFTADVTDGNADTLAAIATTQAALGQVVVALRFGRVDDDLVDAVGTAAAASLTASKVYNAAIAARKEYVAAGRPLPCTNTPN